MESVGIASWVATGTFGLASPTQRIQIKSKQQGTSSLGTIVAISPRGTRIAAATWSRVSLWSLDPSLLLQGELQHYFPVRDYNTRKGFGRLRPTPLSSEGVVHSMAWSSETLLYATTDQGLVKWDIGHMSQGEREDLTLAHDAW